MDVFPSIYRIINPKAQNLLRTVRDTDSIETKPGNNESKEGECHDPQEKSPNVKTIRKQKVQFIMDPIFEQSNRLRILSGRLRRADFLEHPKTRFGYFSRRRRKTAPYRLPVRPNGG
jgi:hypothetical protein